MDIKEIEHQIEQSTDAIIKAGQSISPSHWGVVREKDWSILNGGCCPLGAVVLCTNPQCFGKDPIYCITKLFGVDLDWVKSFIAGYEDQKVGYWGNRSAYLLGEKMRFRFVGQSITFNI